MADLTVRPFQSADAEGPYRVAADAAFFGQPVEKHLEDRQLFCDLVYRYYPTYEPAHAWIAADLQHEVLGFLAGCVDTASYERAMATQILPYVIGGLVQGRYRLGDRTWRYAVAGSWPASLATSHRLTWLAIRRTCTSTSTNARAGKGAAGA
jgi:hypothetical protein